MVHYLQRTILLRFVSPPPPQHHQTNDGGLPIESSVLYVVTSYYLRYYYYGHGGRGEPLKHTQRMAAEVGEETSRGNGKKSLQCRSLPLLRRSRRGIYGHK